MAGKITAKISTKTKENTVGVIAAIIVLLVILLVVAVSFKISSSRRSQHLGTTNSAKVKPEKLVDNAESSSVRIYVERGVIADEEHYSIDMTVNATSRTIRVLRGYERVVESTNSLPNNLEAYRAFLKALERNNFTAVRVDNSGFGFREACPTQRSYRFAQMDVPSQNFDRWYTFCDGKRYGEYGGRVNDTFTLFRNQFPDYNTYTSGVSF